MIRTGAALEIQLLGTLRVWRQGALITEWPTRKSKLLLKMLLTHYGSPIPADRLMDALWGDLPPDKAQNNLWVTVSQLRRVLEPDLPPRAPGSYIAIQDGAYLFDPASDHTLDVTAFRMLVEQGMQAQESAALIEAYEAARALYQSPYLEDDLYEDWFVETRERLRQQYLEMLRALAQAYALAGQYQQAVTALQESLRADNTQEPIYRDLMLYAYAMGDSNSAVQVFEQCRLVLQSELAVEPSEATWALFNQIQQRHVSLVDFDVKFPTPEPVTAVSHSLSRLPFVQRGQEYSLLVNVALEAVQSGKGQVAIIKGEAGIGKTRLSQEVAGYVRQQGYPTLWINCYLMEQSIPYEPVIELVRQLVSHFPQQIKQALLPAEITELVRLTPEVLKHFPDAQNPDHSVSTFRQARLFEIILKLIASVAQAKGLLLIVDDVQWADPSSLQFLHHLAMKIPGKRLMMVSTLRSGEAEGNSALDTFLVMLDRQSYAVQLNLQRLNAEGVAAVLQSYTAHLSNAAEIHQWFFDETAGNPFFVTSILQSIMESGRLHADAAQIDPVALPAHSTDLALPESLRRAILHRMDRLPTEAREVLDASAVLGWHLDPRILGAMVKCEDRTLASILEMLINRQILCEGDGGTQLNFSHDKIREVLYQEISQMRRRTLHRAAAMAIEAAYPQREAFIAPLIHHWQIADNPAKVAQYKVDAAGHALNTGAYQAAVGLLLEVLDQHEVPELDRMFVARVEQQLSAAYLGLGQFDPCAEHSHKALRLLDLPHPTEIGSIRREMFNALIQQFLHRLGIFPARSAQSPDVLQMAVPVCGRLAQLYYVNNKMVPSLFYIIYGLNLAEQAGLASCGEQTAYYAALAMGTRVLKRHRIANLYRRLAVQSIPITKDLNMKCWGIEMLGMRSMMDARWEEALTYLQEAAQIAEQIGDLRRWQEAMMFVARTHDFLGDWARDEELTESIYQMAVRTQDYQMQGYCLHVQSGAALRRGDSAQAEERIEQCAVAFEKAQEATLKFLMVGLRGKIHLAQGRHDLAAQSADEGWRRVQRLKPISIGLYHGYKDWVELQLTLLEQHLGGLKSDQVHSGCKALLEMGHRFDFARPVAWISYSRYLLAAGKVGQAVKAANKGLAYANQLKMPYEQGLAYYQLARCACKDAELESKFHRAAADIFGRLGEVAVP